MSSASHAVDNMIRVVGTKQKKALPHKQDAKRHQVPSTLRKNLRMFVFHLLFSILTDLSECVSSSHKRHIIHCTGRKIGLCATAVKDHLSLLKDRKCLFLYELTFSQGWERKDEVSKLESTPTTLSAQPSTLSHLAFYISAIVPTESVSTSVYQVLAPYLKRVKRSKTWLQVFLKKIRVHFISVNANLCGPRSSI